MDKNFLNFQHQVSVNVSVGVFAVKFSLILTDVNKTDQLQSQSNFGIVSEFSYLSIKL